MVDLFDVISLGHGRDRQKAQIAASRERGQPQQQQRPITHHLATVVLSTSSKHPTTWLELRLVRSNRVYIRENWSDGRVWFVAGSDILLYVIALIVPPVPV